MTPPPRSAMGALPCYGQQAPASTFAFRKLSFAGPRLVVSCLTWLNAEWDCSRMVLAYAPRPGLRDCWAQASPLLRAGGLPLDRPAKTPAQAMICRSFCLLPFRFNEISTCAY